MTQVEIFKDMVEDLYKSMPQERKVEMYEMHLKDTKARNKVRKEILEVKDSSSVNQEMLNNSILLANKRKKKKLAMNEAKESFYNLKPLSMVDFIKSKIALMLLDSEWNFLVNSELTLEEIGDIYNISRERVRQIESRTKAFIKNLNALKILNKDGKVEDILNMAYDSVSKKAILQ